MFRCWSHEVETRTFKLLLSSHQGLRDRERRREGGRDRKNQIESKTSGAWEMDELFFSKYGNLKDEPRKQLRILCLNKPDCQTEHKSHCTQKYKPLSRFKNVQVSPQYNWSTCWGMFATCWCWNLVWKQTLMYCLHLNWHDMTSPILHIYVITSLD